MKKKNLMLLCEQVEDDDAMVQHKIFVLHNIKIVSLLLHAFYIYTISISLNK